MIYLAEITAGLPTSTGRNIVWGTRRKIYNVEVGRLRKKIRDILPPLCFRYLFDSLMEASSLSSSEYSSEYSDTRD